MAEVPITEESYPTMYQLRQLHPDRDPLFTAMEQLSEASEINQFYAEYRQYLIDSGSPEVGVDELAGANLRYVKGHYTKTTWTPWAEAIPDAFSES
jgi:hypothetical protein